MSSNMKKILISGNPNYGLAEALSKKISGDFVSRTNDYDLLTNEGQERLIKKSKKYDVFINLAALSDFAQVKLLKSIWSFWKESNHQGHIISLGSTVDRWVSSGDRIYSVEKAALNRLHDQLSLAAHEKSNIKVSLISPGMLETPGMEKKFPNRNKINLTYLASVIQWVIDSPVNININELSLDPIQDRI